MGSTLTCSEALPGDKPVSRRRRRQLAGPSASTECYLKDAAYTRTLALCLSDHCPSSLRISEREEWWEKNVAVTIMPWTEDMIPPLGYGETLLHAKADIARLGLANIPFHCPECPLEWFKDQNGRNAVGVAISTIVIPLFLSLVRLLPGRSLWYSRLEIALQKPLIGRRHRSPMVGNVGLMPTRGQSLYIAYIIISQTFLSIFPIITTSYPDSLWPDRHVMLQVGDRTGDLAMANFLAVFLFSSRNNILLWMTNWSHSTFLTLHRWISYVLIIETSLHSLILLIYYWTIRDARQQELGWIWGIVGTMALVLLWPASILPVRQKAYEFFLAFHQIFSAIGLIGTFYHIYEFYKYDWGFEIWVYIGGGIWALDRIVRLIRLFSNGIRTATVTALDAEAEYIQIDIDGIVAHGHAYLSFPTLSWRFWENHPYSVLPTFTGLPSQDAAAKGSDSDSAEKKESDSDASSVSSATTEIKPRTTILLRPMNGLTKSLARRLLAGSGKPKRITLPVLVESSYHSNPATHDLAHCSTLPLHSWWRVRSRLAWGVRNECLIRAVEPQLEELKRNPTFQLQTRVGERLSLLDILKEEIEKDGKDALGIVVCGPTGMADEVRFAVGELALKAKRAVVFVDEAFSW
ncbi:metalloreductase [Ephemerocybe angulata]|uniref:Metalloreductase n=1 Tax=Ephemerocybe angulata TaxID=980116 RepID=A0A8H6HD93_9AGAR|nr:metalloreductase [Tulosesus angulatus]